MYTLIFGRCYGLLLRSFGGSILRRFILKKVQTYGNPNSAVGPNFIFSLQSLPSPQELTNSPTHKPPFQATMTTFPNPFLRLQGPNPPLIKVYPKSRSLAYFPFQRNCINFTQSDFIIPCMNGIQRVFDQDRF